MSKNRVYNTGNMDCKVFSFFSGAGFLDLGFENTGFDVVFANEICSDFAYCYRYAREQMGIPSPKYGLANDDICGYLYDNTKQKVLKEQVRKERKDGNLVGFIGGPPCPDFSVAGKNKGSEGKHGVLSQIYMDLICEIKPDFFLFENVKGLWKTSKHRKFFYSLIEQAQKNGYVITYKLVNALEYGAPQDRDRILLFGVLDKSVREGEPIDMSKFNWGMNKGKDAQYIKSLKWPDIAPFGSQTVQPPVGIDEMLTVEYWFKKNDVENHPNSADHFKPKAALRKMESIDEGDVSRKAYKRLHRWRYSPTVAYGNNEVHWHPYKQRRLSAAEALSLQSLPKEFVLPPDMTLSSMFKTIGNGVPYLLAQSVALAIKLFIDECIGKSK